MPHALVTQGAKDRKIVGRMVQSAGIEPVMLAMNKGIGISGSIRRYQVIFEGFVFFNASFGGGVVCHHAGVGKALIPIPGEEDPPNGWVAKAQGFDHGYLNPIGIDPMVTKHRAKSFEQWPEVHLFRTFFQGLNQSAGVGVLHGLMFFFVRMAGL